MINTVRNASREIYNLGEVLCHSKLLTKQDCIISGMGMTNHSVLWALKSPHTMILAEGWRRSVLSILDETASTREQDDEAGELYKKKGSRM